jgi:hypothetical protein
LDRGRLQRDGYRVAALGQLARRRLPRMVFDFCDGGPEDDLTRERNETAFADWEFLPTLLNGTSSRDQSIELFGQRLALTAVPAIHALPGVVEAVAGRIPVLLDGGVRRGSHVVKAVALGATACLIGRPHLWGLTVAGEAGVAQVLEIFRRYIDRGAGARRLGRHRPGRARRARTDALGARIPAAIRAGRAAAISSSGRIMTRRHALQARKRRIGTAGVAACWKPPR